MPRPMRWLRAGCSCGHAVHNTVVPLQRLQQLCFVAKSQAGVASHGHALRHARSELAASPVAMWPLVATCAAPAHCRAGAGACSCFVSDDSGVLTLGVSLPCLDHFEMFVSVCSQALLVLFLRRVLCLGQAIRVVGCLSLAHHSQGLVALTLSDLERSSHGGGERVASTHHSCCIMRKCWRAW